MRQDWRESSGFGELLCLVLAWTVRPQRGLDRPTPPRSTKAKALYRKVVAVSGDAPFGTFVD